MENNKLYMTESGVTTTDVSNHKIYTPFKDGMIGAVRCTSRFCGNVEGIYYPISWSFRYSYLCLSCAFAAQLEAEDIEKRKEEYLKEKRKEEKLRKENELFFEKEKEDENLSNYNNIDYF